MKTMQSTSEKTIAEGIPEENEIHRQTDIFVFYSMVIFGIFVKTSSFKNEIP
jgi:hypothetical protein